MDYLVIENMDLQEWAKQFELHFTIETKPKNEWNEFKVDLKRVAPKLFKFLTVTYTHTVKPRLEPKVELKAKFFPWEGLRDE